MPDSRNPTGAVSVDRLIIVYNANDGWTSALMDAVHKMVRPETYECSLCMISHGALAMRRPWRKYLESLTLEKQFYHRQDFASAYPADVFPAVIGFDLPAIFIQSGSELHCLLSRQELDRMSDVQALIGGLDGALNSFRKWLEASSSQSQPFRYVPEMRSLC